MHRYASFRLATRILAASSAVICAGSAHGQFGEQVVLFPDDLTGATCEVVNAANARLIVLFESGNFVLVEGVDERLSEYVVTSDNSVFFNGDPAGGLAFAEDADGFPTLFWFTRVGTIVEIDSFSAAPLDSGLFPEDLSGTECDICVFLDDQSFCDPIDDEPAGGDPNNDFSVLFDLCGVGSAQAMLAIGLGLPLCRRRRAGDQRIQPLL